MRGEVPSSGRQLHRYLLDSLLKAPYSYLASIDSGVMLKRFSQDMVIIDANLSGSAFLTVIIVLRSIVEGALTISGSVYLTAVFPAVIMALHGIQYVYLRTSRQLRYVDLEAHIGSRTMVYISYSRRGP